MEKRLSNPVNVLCIEASDLILTWLVPFIARHGCHVTEARHLQAALTAIQKNEPLDLVLLGDISRPTDLVFPTTPEAEMKILLDLRNHPKYKKTPIIVFTSIDWITEARDNGATNYLIKPAGSDELEALILPYLSSPGTAIGA